MGKSSGNDIVEELTKDILNKMPDEFNIKQVQVRLGIIKILFSQYIKFMN